MASESVLTSEKEVLAEDRDKNIVIKKKVVFACA